MLVAPLLPPLLLVPPLLELELEHATIATSDDARKSVRVGEGERVGMRSSSG